MGSPYAARRAERGADASRSEGARGGDRVVLRRAQLRRDGGPPVVALQVLGAEREALRRLPEAARRSPRASGRDVAVDRLRWHGRRRRNPSAPTTWSTTATRAVSRDNVQPCAN